MKYLLVLFYLTLVLNEVSAQDKYKLTKTADSLMDKQEYQKALDIYEKLLQQENTNPQYLTQSGVANFRLKNFEKAKEKFRMATLYAEGNELYLSNLSAAYSNMNENQKAYEYAIQALNVKATALTVYNAMANANNIHKYDETFRLSIKYPHLKTKNQFNYVIGLAHYHSKHYQDANNFLATYLNNLDAEDSIINTYNQAKIIYFNSLCCQWVNSMIYGQDFKPEDIEKISQLKDEFTAENEKNLSELRLFMVLITSNLLGKKDNETIKNILSNNSSQKFKETKLELDAMLHKLSDELYQTILKEKKVEKISVEELRKVLLENKYHEIFTNKMVNGNIT